VLGSLAERGPMHGHGIRLLAEEEHIDEWADFGAGAIYGVLKRLTAEGLIEELRTEREGNYPERQVYDITSAGSAALDQIRAQALEEIVLRPDPVDLALARLDDANLANLKETLQTRLNELRSLLTKSETQVTSIAMYLTVMEQHIMRHKALRLRGEIEWHEQLLAALPEIISDEKSRKGRLQ
jgi:DNA-binding PadR family transcriptional regulator